MHLKLQTFEQCVIHMACLLHYTTSGSSFEGETRLFFILFKGELFWKLVFMSPFILFYFFFLYIVDTFSVYENYVVFIDCSHKYLPYSFLLFLFFSSGLFILRMSIWDGSATFIMIQARFLFIYFPCMSVCLFVTDKHQNGSTDPTQFKSSMICALTTLTVHAFSRTVQSGYPVQSRPSQFF